MSSRQQLIPSRITCPLCGGSLYYVNSFFTFITGLKKRVCIAPECLFVDPRPARIIRSERSSLGHFSAVIPIEDPVFENVPPTAQPSGEDATFSRYICRVTEGAISDQVTTAPLTAPIVPTDNASVGQVFERAVRESFDPVLRKYLSDNSATLITRLKPSIREWLDEHFTALLEEVIRTETERVRTRGKS
jgi:cell pole-organizing protein PopZ